MRTIIFHYHLFKNAGTSLDAMLKANFGAGWVTREFKGAHRVVQQEVSDWVRSHPAAVAFSSHTALLPPPQGADLLALPLIFVRHPIDRIASAYAFERTQGIDGTGAVLARNTTLAGYIEVRLSMSGDRQCRNFHCDRLARMFDADTGPEDQRALRALDALPFVGLVEAYGESIRRMTAWLKPHFPQIREVLTAKNVTRGRGSSLEDKLARVREQVGDRLYRRLEEVNAADLAVFAAVRRRYAPGP